MDTHALFDGLLTYLYLLVIITFHEYAHAWAAWKCGDDTARLQGRVSLNPVVHMDMIGTVILPLLVVLLGATGGDSLAKFIIGWGKPVPVNINNLRQRRLHDTFVALAGPGMNVLLAVGLMALCRVGQSAGLPTLMEICVELAMLSLFLCYFNLLPIPPLDGSHVLKNAVGLSDEAYWHLSQFGFILIIVVVQITFVQRLLTHATYGTLSALAWLFRLGVGSAG